MASASTTSPDLVAGFRLGRRLGERTWEATQTELGRRVALRRLAPDEPFDARSWPEGEGVVRLFAVVDAPDGTYVATRFIAGARTLAELASARPARRRRWLAAAATSLDGAVHGDLTDHDILVDADGRVLVTGFGRAGEDASPADDQAALERLRTAPARRRPRALALAVAGTAVVGAAVAVAVHGGDPPVPPVAAGATAYGSALAGGAVETVDCADAPVSGSSLPCTILQTTHPGESLVVAERGLVQGFAVRGVRGRVALQILMPSAKGYVTINSTPLVKVSDPDRPTYVRTDRSVPKGARFALEVAPDAAVGIRRGVSGAATARFFSPLRSMPPRRPDTSRGDGEELLLRVDVVSLDG